MWIDQPNIEWTNHQIKQLQDGDLFGIAFHYAYGHPERMSFALWERAPSKGKHVMVRAVYSSDEITPDRAPTSLGDNGEWCESARFVELDQDEQDQLRAALAMDEGAFLMVIDQLRRAVMAKLPQYKELDHDERIQQLTRAAA